MAATFGNVRSHLRDRFAISEVSQRLKKTRLQLGGKLGRLGGKIRQIRRKIRRFGVPFPGQAPSSSSPDPSSSSPAPTSSSPSARTLPAAVPFPATSSPPLSSRTASAAARTCASCGGALGGGARGARLLRQHRRLHPTGRRPAAGLVRQWGRQTAGSSLARITSTSTLCGLPPGSRTRQAVGRRLARSYLARTTFISVLYGSPPGSRLWPAAGGATTSILPSHVTTLNCSHSHIATPHHPPTHSPKFRAGSATRF